MRLAATLFLIMLPSLVEAHSWYDSSCCSNQDCYELNYTPKKIKGGYFAEGLLFSKEKLKESRNNRWHACILNGKPQCLYAPMGM